MYYCCDSDNPRIATQKDSNFLYTRCSPFRIRAP